MSKEIKITKKARECTEDLINSGFVKEEDRKPVEVIINEWWVKYSGGVEKKIDEILNEHILHIEEGDE